MRQRILPAIAAALVLVAGTAAPAFAGAGLPVLSTMTVGQTEVTLYGDSLFVHTGTNKLTLEVTGLPEGATMALNLTGPDGQVVQVPLKPLRFVEGPAEDHGGEHGEEPAAASGDHGASQPAAAGGDHGDGHSGEADAAGAVTWFRGKAVVSATGTWKAQLLVNGDKATDELKVVDNGPDPFYLAATGLAMGGTIIYGAIQRRRQPQEGRS